MGLFRKDKYEAVIMRVNTMKIYFPIMLMTVLKNRFTTNNIILLYLFNHVNFISLINVVFFVVFLYFPSTLESNYSSDFTNAYNLKYLS